MNKLEKARKFLNKKTEELDLDSQKLYFRGVEIEEFSRRDIENMLKITFYKDWPKYFSKNI